MKRMSWMVAVATLALGGVGPGQLVASAQPQQTPAGQPGTGGAAQSGADLEQKSRTALDNITAALTALQANDRAKANASLDDAVKILADLYQNAPGNELIRQLNATQGQLMAQVRQQPGRPPTPAPGGTIDFAPLLARFSELKTYLTPSAVAQVNEAQRQYGSGDMQAASKSLQLARDQVMADLAFLPIEDAYARARAAQADLQAGHDQLAERLLQGVPIVMARLHLSAPLVPVRFALLAAADAADAGNWSRARELVTQAKSDLQSLQQVANEDLARQLKPLADRASNLQQQLEAGGKPASQQLRDLAQAIGGLKPG